MKELRKISLKIPESVYTDGASLVEIDGFEIWICKVDKLFQVFYNECSHMGSSLSRNSSNQLVCIQHGWTYDFNGMKINSDGIELKRVKIVSQNNGELEILLPKKQETLFKRQLEYSLEISVISHATLELSYRNYSVLFDPWINGPTYYGSWHLHPNPIISTKSILPNSIVITHPHPDHFHLPTLKDFNKSTPIYYPRFPSGIIEKGLIDLKFTNLNPMVFNEKFFINPFTSIQFLQPLSVWEDTAVLICIEDNERLFSWLNLVDAGLVFESHNLPELDLLTSSFDQGASGYPLTWTHLSDSRKIKILEARKLTTLDMLVKRANKLRAKYFLPFAGHWRLKLPEHKKYAEMIPHTTLEEIENKFIKESNFTKPLCIKPGEMYDFLSGTKQKLKEKYGTDTRSNLEPIPKKYKKNTTLSAKMISQFRIEMHKLQNFAESFGVESVQFRVKVKYTNFQEIFIFNSSLGDNKDPVLVEVQIPISIFILFAEGKANWDHIAIGYWGEWTRKPDIYPLNFMRLLQSGNNQITRKFEVILESQVNDMLERTVGDIIESNPEYVPYYFTRLGLPCLSCSRSNSESLKYALSLHNIDTSSNMYLLRELASLVM